MNLLFSNIKLTKVQFKFHGLGLVFTYFVESYKE